MGELEAGSLARREGGMIAGYVGSWPSSSRFLALDSSDSPFCDDAENCCLYGDIGIAFDTPFNANLGGDGKPSRPNELSASSSSPFSDV